MGFFSGITKAVGGLLGGGQQQGGGVTSVPRQELQTLLGRSFVDQQAGTAGIQGNRLGTISGQLLSQTAQQNRLQPKVSGSLERLLGLAGQEAARGQGITPQAEFEQIQSLLQPGQQQEQADLESRLFAQGRLGGTGGSNEQAALRLAQGQVTKQAAQEAIGSSRDARTQALSNALGLTQAGAGGLSGLQSQSLQNLLGLNQAQIDQVVAANAISSAPRAATPSNKFGNIAAGAGTGFSVGGPVGAAVGGLGGLLLG